MLDQFASINFGPNNAAEEEQGKMLKVATESTKEGQFAAFVCQK
jgi:hypothetical protein